MKKLFGFIFVTLLFFISIVAFFPKEKLYFLLQKELLVHDISVNSQEVSSSPFSITTNNTFVLLSGAKVAKVGEIDFSVLGINIKNIEGTNSFKNVVPDISSVSIDYKFGQFANVQGSFGSVLGYFDLTNRKITFEANIKHNIWKKYNTLFSNFKKIGDKYTYEFTF